MKKDYGWMVFDVVVWGLLAGGLYSNIRDLDWIPAAVDLVLGIWVSRNIQARLEKWDFYDRHIGNADE